MVFRVVPTSFLPHCAISFPRPTREANRSLSRHFQNHVHSFISDRIAPTLSSRHASPFSRWLVLRRRPNTRTNLWRWLMAIIKLQIAGVIRDKQWKFTGYTIERRYRQVESILIRCARLTSNSKYVSGDFSFCNIIFVSYDTIEFWFVGYIFINFVV